MHSNYFCKSDFGQKFCFAITLYLVTRKIKQSQEQKMSLNLETLLTKLISDFPVHLRGTRTNFWESDHSPRQVLEDDAEHCS